MKSCVFFAILFLFAQTNLLYAVLITPWSATPDAYGSTDDLTVNWDEENFSYSATLNTNASLQNVTLTDWDAVVGTTLTISSGSGSHTLTINNLSLNGDPFHLVIGSGITLTVNGLATTNGGVITVENGGAIVFNNTVTLAGAGVTINVNSGGNIDINSTLIVSEGINNLNIEGNMTTTNLVANGGSQDINILSGGTFLVTNDATFDGSATFTVQNAGVMDVNGNMSISGGSTGTVNGTLYVDGILSFGNDANIISGTGNIYAPNIVCSNTPCPNFSGTLPVKLAYFKADKTYEGIKCTWATNSETNNDYFSIERSSDGINFETIANVPGAGNSTQLLVYSYTDPVHIPGAIYYRLKQTDFDGKYSYSNIISTYATMNPIITVDNNSLQFNAGNFKGELLISICNIYGQVIWQSNILTDDMNQVKLPFNSPMGIYFLRAVQNNTLLFNLRFIKS